MQKKTASVKSVIIFGGMAFKILNSSNYFNFEDAFHLNYDRLLIKSSVML